MAESINTTDTETLAKDEKKLEELFLDGWKGYEDLEETTLPFNGKEFQDKVKSSMESFENVTRIVSEIGMFSPNELIDEVSTESLQYLLLPFFLGKLALKLQREDRLEVLNIAEVYFKDYLQRCQEYSLCDPLKKEKKNEAIEKSTNVADEMAELMRAAQTRNEKIAQFNRKKELEKQIKLMKDAVRNQSVDDEIKRDFFLNFLKKSIIDAQEEIESLRLEKQMVEMRKMHMTAGKIESAEALSDNNRALTSSHGHGHGHSHGHHGHHAPPPKPKPLQPFIITRNAAQKAVFGAGYPSLPIMTVDEFYTQRVADGIFPDDEKVAKMNQAQAAAADKDPNEKEDEEKAVEELQVERDDDEYLERMRRMDEYKDVVRRGDGNRHNRS